MNGDALHIVGADGTPLVVMTLSRFLALTAGEENAGVAEPIRIPAEVTHSIGERGMSPLEAWRRYRGLSQSALAEQSGVHRVTIVRMEAAGAGAGRRESRVKLAAALSVPVAYL
ncbi:MAG: helix-turn-helix transcriptional regulator [Sphingomonadaceae bacterium]|nr:helix-turn-helix transcriptional regulator [Sphingomonadaceae bacterium]